MSSEACHELTSIVLLHSIIRFMISLLIKLDGEWNNNNTDLLDFANL